MSESAKFEKKRLVYEYGDDDEEYYQDDVVWQNCECDDELDESAYTVCLPTDDTRLLEQFGGNLEDADASASQEYVSAIALFKKTREILSRVKSAMGFFLSLALVFLAAWPNHPLVVFFAKSRGKGKKGKRK